MPTPPITYIRTARIWGTWRIEQGWTCDEWDEGAGAVLGGATLIRDLGQVVPAGLSTVVARSPSALLGRYVQVLEDDPAGDQTLSWTDEGGTPQTATASVVWSGKALRSELVEEGPRQGRESVQCLGIVSVLGQLVIHDGFGKRVGASGGGSSNLFRYGAMPAFNRLVGADRSAAKTDPADGPVHYYHSLPGSGTPTPWRASDIVEYLLAVFARGGLIPDAGTTPAALSWQLSDPQHCLDYPVHELEADGRSVLDVINDLASPALGIIWWPTVAGSTATITVASVSPTALFYTGTAYGDYILPAAPSPATVDLTADDVHLIAWAEDASAVADVIEVVGNRPWRGIGMVAAATLGLDSTVPALKRDAFYAPPGVDSGVGYYRWDVNSEWKGTIPVLSGTAGSVYSLTPGADGLRNRLVVAGDGSMDGSRQIDTGESWQPQALELTATIPGAIAYNSGDNGDRIGPALLYTGSVWLDLRNPQPGDVSMSPGVENEPYPRVTIAGGEADAVALSEHLSVSGAFVWMAVGVREPAPLRVRWMRPQVDWPSDAPRVLRVVDPTCEHWSVVGVPEYQGYDTTPTVTSATYRDDTPRMRGTLLRLLAYHGQPAVALSWWQVGSWAASATHSLGRLISAATTGWGSRTVGSVITRRRVVYAPLEQAGTYRDCTPQRPGMESVR